MYYRQFTYKFNGDESFCDVWNRVKKDFKFGSDFIELDSKGYIIICPFHPDVMINLNLALRQNFIFRFTHCVCCGYEAFNMWYKALYTDGRLKTFFIKKDIDLNTPYNEQPYENEFTGWIDYGENDFLHFAHITNNHLVTGEYGSPSTWESLADFNLVYSHRIDDSCKKYVSKMNKLVADIFDDLFRIYDMYVEELEDNLHTCFDNEE